MTSFSLPEYTWEEFSDLAVKAVSEAIKWENLDVDDLVFAPKLDKENIRPWLEWSLFCVTIPRKCVIRYDQRTVWIISGDEAMLMIV